MKDRDYVKLAQPLSPERVEAALEGYVALGWRIQIRFISQIPAFRVDILDGEAGSRYTVFAGTEAEGHKKMLKRCSSSAP